MRQLTHLVLSISMLAPGLLVAQEEAPATDESQAAATSSLPSFVLKMTEFTIPALDEGLAQTLNKGTDWEAAIDDLATQNQLASYEQLHLTLYDGLKARAQFGRRVPIVTGTSSTRFGNVNNITMENVGTLIGVLPRYRQETGDVVLELEYESSRIGPTDDSSTVPPTETLTFSSTLHLALDQPVLVTSSQSHSTKLLIAELKQSGDFQPRAVSIQVAASVATVEPPDGEVPQAQPAEGFRDDPENAMRRTGEVIFRRADQDRDGFLTADEMSKFPLPSQQSPERFAEFDADDDQRISLEEFVNALRNLRGRFPSDGRPGRNRPE